MTAGLVLLFLGGALLARFRFRVLILIPATILVLAIVVAIMVSEGQGWPAIMVAAVVAATAIQAGYLTGSLAMAWWCHRARG